MKRYYHSVRLDKEQCKGCTNCIKRCPTEAIRVRDGKARIIEELCIDCGECIKICPNHAKIAVDDPLERLQDFKYTIALPAPSFYGQFDSQYSLKDILSCFLSIGFDDVFEVAHAAEHVSYAIQQYIKENKNKRPLISQACPAVLGLIQVRFPLLLDNVIPIDSPMNIAAKMAKEEAVKKTGYDIKDIGAFFITPCPAKITSIRQPADKNEIYVDGAISMASIYGLIIKKLKETENSTEKEKGLQRACGLGIAWGRSSGELEAINCGSMLAVDEIHNVIGVLEEVEKGELTDIEYLECQACAGGCVGGCLTIKNPFLARLKLNQLANKSQNPEKTPGHIKTKPLAYFLLKEKYTQRNISPLDSDLGLAIEKMKQLEKTLEDLPGLDCSSCGCPNCRALAEDIIRGYALETDCVFKLRKRVEILAEEVLTLAKKVPPAMGSRKES